MRATIERLLFATNLDAKTLKQIDTRLFQYEVLYSQDSDWEEIIIAALQNRLQKRKLGLAKMSHI